MNAKKFAARIGAVFLTVSVIATPALAGVNGRQAHQQHRIAQGWRSGELTGREAARLERQQHRIARTEHRMRATNGMNAYERARLQYRQDLASANIYGHKHDGWHR